MCKVLGLGTWFGFRNGKLRAFEAGCMHVICRFGIGLSWLVLLGWGQSLCCFGCGGSFGWGGIHVGDGACDEGIGLVDRHPSQASECDPADWEENYLG